MKGEQMQRAYGWNRMARVWTLLSLGVAVLALSGCQNQGAAVNNPATTVPNGAPPNVEAQKAGGSGMPQPPGK